MNRPLLNIDGLRVEFGTKAEPLVAVKDVGLDVGAGEIVGLVGESGSGKSLSCRAVMRLLAPPGRVAAGSIHFDGRDVLAMSKAQLRDFRAHDVGMIYQDPFSSLNPVFRVGAQIAETLRLNRSMSKRAAEVAVSDLLASVGIPDPTRRALAYPHELSGGMRQRIMIALATASQPRLLVADEPTTALDVTTQAQILDLLMKLREDRGMSVLLVSHDFGVIAQVCDRVAVMYGGRIVEVGSIAAIYATAQHPYTRALLDSVPTLAAAGRGLRRSGIPGQPPELTEALPGCVFAPRCTSAAPICLAGPIDLLPVAAGHTCACVVRPFQLAPPPRTAP